MLTFAEKELSVINNNKQTLSVWVTDKETDKIELLVRKGYTKVHTEPVRIFSYNKPFIDVKLPDGYSILSLEDENDYKKIHNCLWKGFNHGDNPTDNIDGRMLLQSGPNSQIGKPVVLCGCATPKQFESCKARSLFQKFFTLPLFAAKNSLKTVFVLGEV